MQETRVGAITKIARIYKLHEKMTSESESEGDTRVSDKEIKQTTNGELVSQ